jgi:hypothetical protein
MPIKPWLVLSALVLIGCGTPPAPASTPHSIESRAPAETAVSTTASSPTVRPTQKPTLAATRTPRPTRTLRPTVTSPAEPEPIEIGPFQPVSIPDQPPGGIIDLRTAPDGALWLKTTAGLGSLKDDRWILYPDIAGTLTGFDAAGHTWLISEMGDRILAWDGAAWTSYGEESGWTETAPVYRFREDVATDKRGWVWLTAGESVRAFDGQRWTSLAAEAVGFTRTQDMIAEGLDFWLTDVIADGEGDIWVADCAWLGPGPDGHGARWFTGEEWQGQTSRVVASGCIYDMEVDGEGGIWVGVNGDLWRYLPGHGWQMFPHPVADPTGDVRWGFLESLALDPAGEPWVTLHRCGGASCDTGQYALFHVTADAWTPIIESQNQQPGDLAFDAASAAWLCTEDGLYRITSDVPEPIGGEDAAGCTIEADAAGRVWLALPDRSTLWQYDAVAPRR